MGKIPEVFWGWKQETLPKLIYLWLWCRRRFTTFGSGPQGEIYWTSFSASPDARAEGVPVTTEAAHLCPSTSLKKVRPYLLILWCCSMIKPFPSAELGVLLLGSDTFQANGAGQTLTGYHGQEWFFCAPGCWATCAPSCPEPCCLACSMRQQQSMTLFPHEEVLFAKM